MLVRILIYGQVQGVFFRRSARLKAQELDVSGWIKNKNDGSVELVAEGLNKNIDEFIKWCKSGPPFAKVENVEIEKLKISENFDDFSIKD